MKTVLSLMVLGLLVADASAQQCGQSSCGSKSSCGSSCSQSGCNSGQQQITRQQNRPSSAIPQELSQKKVTKTQVLTASHSVKWAISPERIAVKNHGVVQQVAKTYSLPTLEDDTVVPGIPQNTRSLPQLVDGLAMNFQLPDIR